MAKLLYIGMATNDDPSRATFPFIMAEGAIDLSSLWPSGFTEGDFEVKNSSFGAPVAATAHAEYDRASSLTG